MHQDFHLRTANRINSLLAINALAHLLEVDLLGEATFTPEVIQRNPPPISHMPLNDLSLSLDDLLHSY